MKKNKILETFKSFIVIVLLIYAVYQFFDMYNDQSLLESIKTLFNKEEKNEEYILAPEKIMISFGDGEYVCIDENSNQEELVNNYSGIIFKEIFLSNKSFSSSHNKVIDILNEKSIILCYDEYNKTFMSKLLNIENDKVLKLVNEIDYIVIIPNSTSKEKAKVYLIDNENVFETEISSDTIELYGLIDEINLFNQMNIYHLSENENYKGSFGKYVFMPVVENDFSIFENDKNITITNPFKNVNLNTSNSLNDNTLIDDPIENYANMFFENPKAKWKIEKDDNTVIYGDGEKTITINKDGFVSYTYSVLSDKKNKYDDALKIANEKIQNDIYMANYLKLSNVIFNDNNEYEFYFDYYINGIKIELSNAIKEKYKISYPVSMSVSGDEVSNFKAIVLKIDIKENEKDIETETNDGKQKYNVKTYDEIINETLKAFPDLKIKDIKIGYFKASMNSDVNLKWIVETYDGFFTYDLFK